MDSWDFFPYVDTFCNHHPGQDTEHFCRPMKFIIPLARPDTSPKENHCFDFQSHRLVLPYSELHINRIIWLQLIVLNIIYNIHIYIFMYFNKNTRILCFLEMQEICPFLGLFRFSILDRDTGTKKYFSTIVKQTHGVSMIKSENWHQALVYGRIGYVGNHGELMKPCSFHKRQLQHNIFEIQPCLCPNQ